MNTPTCPACGAKFAHKSKERWCSKCFLPDDVRDRGGRAIARWKRKTIAHPLDVKQAQALKSHGENASRGARKRRNKHGRKGVKHA